MRLLGEGSRLNKLVRVSACIGQRVTCTEAAYLLRHFSSWETITNYIGIDSVSESNSELATPL